MPTYKSLHCMCTAGALSALHSPCHKNFVTSRKVGKHYFTLRLCFAELSFTHPNTDKCLFQKWRHEVDVEAVLTTARKVGNHYFTLQLCFAEFSLQIHSWHSESKLLLFFVCFFALRASWFIQFGATSKNQEYLVYTLDSGMPVHSYGI